MKPFTFINPQTFTLQELYNMKLEDIKRTIPQGVREKIDPLMAIPLLMCADNKDNILYRNIRRTCQELRKEIEKAYGNLPEKLKESDMCKETTITAVSKNGKYQKVNISFKDYLSVSKSLYSDPHISDAII